ncbi:EcsC family protein [Nocardioides sp. zg-DK7169]|uniref:EcsC family protein n=1 Tax=Nocardioides sp. zg-DK7169 TaxID=2736600 RepID=UPI0020A6AC74|nr:EcsC family protein [Nocardioides sp. zg-DK7169]
MALSLGRQLAPRAISAAPGLTASFVREALQRAIHGAGPLPGAVRAAESALRGQGGDVDKAVRAVIDDHVRYAGAQGFLTNVGGLVTAAVAIPTNVAGLALVQCRMIAVIAHLRGHDLDDPRVRNAVITCLIGGEDVDKLVGQRKLPAPPMALATAPVHDPDLDKVIAAEVTAAIIAGVAGKRLATTVGRRVPVVGGLVGLGADGWATWRVGRYAAGELLARPRAHG